MVPTMRAIPLMRLSLLSIWPLTFSFGSFPARPSDAPPDVDKDPDVLWSSWDDFELLCLDIENIPVTTLIFCKRNQSKKFYFTLKNNTSVELLLMNKLLTLFYRCCRICHVECFSAFILLDNGKQIKIKSEYEIKSFLKNMFFSKSRLSKRTTLLHNSAVALNLKENFIKDISVQRHVKMRRREREREIES